MQEIDQLFEECKNEILSSNDNFCFELGTDLFLSNRDSEEIKLLFNLARLKIEKPEAVQAGESLLTSDLRKISVEELQTVLKATEKAIDLPVISLKEIKSDNARKISTILLKSDIKDNDYLYGKTAKKINTAGNYKRLSGFIIDLTVTILLSAICTFALTEYYFEDLKGLIPNISTAEKADLLPVLSLQLVTLSFFFIAYPLFSFILTGHSLGSLLCSIRLAGTKTMKVRASQIIIRCTVLPFSILLFSYIRAISKNETLHDELSGTRFIDA